MNFIAFGVSNSGDIILFIIGSKHKAEWVSSVRSMATMLIIFTFCVLAGHGKIEPKDFMLIVSLVMNFYFLAKQRPGNGHGDTGTH